jgi:DNA-binding transcriptional ArsR family regulator
MFTKISVVAGGILDLLEDRVGPISLKELDMLLDDSQTVITMSIGWLAREGYIHLEKNGYDYLISLNIPKERIIEVYKVEEISAGA